MKHQTKPAQKGPLVKLWGHVGTALIIAWKSGVRYSNQTMGTACAHPQLEGVLVPLGNEVHADGQLQSLESKLYDYFVGPVYRGSGAQHGLTEKDADVVDALLQSQHEFSNIKVNRVRLHDSHEAWVFVLIQKRDERLPVFEGFGPSPLHAVLTWTNSD